MVKDTRWCWGKSIVLSEDGRNCYDRNFNFHEEAARQELHGERIVELNQQGYEDVLPASIEISVELCQEVPLLVVELDNQLGPHVSDHLQPNHVGHNIDGTVQEFEGIKFGMEPLTTRSR